MLIWLTAYLASKTGWREEYIQSLPFYKVLLYLHSYNVLDGCNTSWLKADATAVQLNTVADLDNIIQDL